MSRLTVRTADFDSMFAMEATLNVDVGEQPIWYPGCDESNMAYRDYGVVPVDVTELEICKTRDGGKASFVYNDRIWSGTLTAEEFNALLVDSSLPVDFNDDFTEAVRMNEEDRLNKEEYDPAEDEYYEKLMEGSKMGMRKYQRTAADDAAQQLIAHDWTLVDEHTLTSDVEYFSYNLGQVEVFFYPDGSQVYKKDFGIVEIEAEVCKLVIQDSGACLTFTYDGHEYECDMGEMELADFVNKGVIPSFSKDFDDAVADNEMERDLAYEPEPYEGREYDKYIDEYEYRNEPGNRYYTEGQHHSRLRRTAMGDVAKLLRWDD